MGVRVEYEVKELPSSYVTRRTEYAFEDEPNGKKDKNGNVRQIMVPKEIEERGGWLVIVRGNPGHSIRFTSKDQLVAFKLILDTNQPVRPRLVNTETGEECNEAGVPLSVVSVIGESVGHDNGRVETDIDVTRNDDQLEMDMSDPAEAAVAGVAKALE